MNSKRTKRKGAADAAPVADWVHSRARDVLTARRNELIQRFPQLHESVSIEFANNAQDVVGFFNTWGRQVASNPPMTYEDAADILLMRHVEAVDRNESGASSELHGFLANQLHKNALTTAACHLLADMHIALSRGVPADQAMLAKPPTGRPSSAERDARILRFMETEEAMRELSRTSSVSMTWRTKAESYKEAARMFGVAVKTIRNVCSGRG